jgi:hypothetical protein
MAAMAALNLSEYKTRQEVDMALEAAIPVRSCCCCCCCCLCLRCCCFVLCATVSLMVLLCAVVSRRQQSVSYQPGTAAPLYAHICLTSRVLSLACQLPSVLLAPSPLLSARSV